MAKTEATAKVMPSTERKVTATGKGKEPARSKPGKGAAANGHQAVSGAQNSQRSQEAAPNGHAKKNGILTKGKGREETKRHSAKPASSDKNNLDENAVLLREIQSLGGDEEDFDLLKNIEDDSDDEGNDVSAVKDDVDEKKLAKELKSFMASLGDLKSFHKQVLSTSVDEEEPVESEDEDESASEAEVESESSPSDNGLDATAIAPAVKENKASSEESEEEDDDGHSGPSDLPHAQSSRAAQAPDAKANVRSVKTDVPTRSGMLIDPNPRWYEIELPELPQESVPGSSMPSGKDLETLQTHGAELLQELGHAFAGSLSSDVKGKNNPLNTTSTLSTSDRAFINTILTSGTESDKLSALILLSSSSPLHTTTYLNQLLGLTKKKSRDQAVRAIRAIADWIQGGSTGGSASGLPDRKLKWFAEQQGLSQVVNARKQGLKKNGKLPGDEHLVMWAFEDWLKKWYFELLQVMEGLLHDPLPFVRAQVTGFTASLLTGKPEQEQNLLRLLVDKLGDSDKTVSSRTSHYILQVLQSHPMMKGIVVRELAALVLKPVSHTATVQRGSAKGKGPVTAGPSATAGVRSGDHARYYGIITLNQVMLSRSEQDKQVANKLLETYFSIFQDLLGTYASASETVDSVAQPQHTLKDRKQRRDEKRGKEVKKETGLEGLSRQDRRKVMKSQQSLESESKLMAAVLTGVNRAFPYSDLEGDVLHARVDTLFRIIHTGTFNVGIQALMLIFQVSSRQQSVSDRFYRVLYDTLVDHRLADCSKQAMYLNLLFKALKADTSNKRVAAFVKRLVQIMAYHQPPFVCGALFLLGELFNLTAGLRNMLTEPEEHDDDVEVFKDAPESDNDKVSTVVELSEEPGEKKRSTVNGSEHTSYDGRKRDPQFANAAASCLWELAPLLSHYHPSVALHASQLLYGQNITTKADLELHTLSHFLDRFVYRNPKKTAQEAVSIMKPGSKGLDRSGMVLMRKGALASTHTAEAPLNNDAFAKKQEVEVPVDQIFFHRFFKQKMSEESNVKEKIDKNKKKRKAGRDDDDSDLGSDDDISIGDDDGAEAADMVPDDSDMEDKEAHDVEEDEEEEEEEEGSELDEDEIWKAMKASMPSAKGDDDLMDDDSESGSEGDDSVEEFAYSDSDGEDAAMDAALAGDDDEEDDDDEEIAEDDAASFFPDEDVDDVPTFEEDEDDLLGSDDDIQLDDEIDLPGLSSSLAGKDGKKRTDASSTSKNKKRKLKHLPAFASADDWKDLIDRDESD